MSQARTDSIYWSDDVKAKVRRIAEIDNRSLSQEICWLVEQEHSRRFPPTSGDAPAIVEALCDVCGAERAFVWRAHWEAEGMVIELYDCPECGATKSLKTLSQLREAKGSAC